MMNKCWLKQNEIKINKTLNNANETKSNSTKGNQNQHMLIKQKPNFEPN